MKIVKKIIGGMFLIIPLLTNVSFSMEKGVVQGFNDFAPPPQGQFWSQQSPYVAFDQQNFDQQNINHSQEPIVYQQMNANSEGDLDFVLSGSEQGDTSTASDNDASSNLEDNQQPLDKESSLETIYDAYHTLVKDCTELQGKIYQGILQRMSQGISQMQSQGISKKNLAFTEKIVDIWGGVEKILDELYKLRVHFLEGSWSEGEFQELQKLKSENNANYNQCRELDANLANLEQEQVVLDEVKQVFTKKLAEFEEMQTAFDAAKTKLIEAFDWSTVAGKQEVIEIINGQRQEFKKFESQFKKLLKKVQLAFDTNLEARSTVQGPSSGVVSPSIPQSPQQRQSLSAPQIQQSFPRSLSSMPVVGHMSYGKTPKGVSRASQPAMKRAFKWSSRIKKSSAPKGLSPKNRKMRRLPRQRRAPLRNAKRKRSSKRMSPRKVWRQRGFQRSLRSDHSL